MSLRLSAPASRSVCLAAVLSLFGYATDSELRAAAPPAAAEPTQVFPVGRARFDGLVFSPDQRWLVGWGSGPGGRGSGGVLFDLRAGKEVGAFRYPPASERAALLSFLPDISAFVVSARSLSKPPPAAEYTIHIVEVPSCKVRKSFPVFRGRGGTGAVCPDGKSLVVSGFEEAAALYDLATGKELAVLKGSGKQPKVDDPRPTKPGESHKFLAHVTRSMALSADGKWLAVGTNGGWLAVWDLPARRELWYQQVFDPSDPITHVCFSPDGRAVAALSRDKVGVWTRAKGGFLAEDRWVGPGILHFFPDGEGLLLRDRLRWTGLVRWEMVGNRRVKPAGVIVGKDDRPRINARATALSADGSLLAVIDLNAKGAVAVYDLRALFPPK